ncbi:IDEAL domain-containing protein [Paenibacillus thailandensis]|uniref:IDEAL domain-containing protein n=1 Tax=Paenibacillus thailandensis TaxID=393250 RepID=A0ABW5QWL7_9BACL
MKYEVGDWVQGRSAEGEFITGYLEASDHTHGVAKVRVVQSDNEGSAGKLIAVRHSWLRELPEYTERSAVQLESLIDIALAAKDEAWFYELTADLNKVRGSSGGKEAAVRIAPGIVNRLGIYGNK